MAPANAPAAEAAATRAQSFHTYDTQPDRYAHWKLACDGPVATLTLDVDEDRGLNPGYKLKLNSYDLGVDIELADALQRIRFEHPEVRSVIMTSGKARVFCSGAMDVNHLDERYGGRQPDIIDNSFTVVDFDNGVRGMLR